MSKKIYAKVTARDFRWSPDGHTTVTHNKGTILEGETAELAIASKCAKACEAPKVEEPKDEAKKPKETKAQKPPSNK